MTQGDAGAAGEAADPGRVAALQPVDSSAWAPLGLRVFRWLWLSVLISWIGTWMQIVGAPVAARRRAQRAGAGVVGAGGEHSAHPSLEVSGPRREHFVSALRAGGRYIWHEPVVRRILLRAILFVAPAMALWGLLPLIASRRLGLGADGYGVLFGAFGVGAIVGAVVLGRVRDRLSNDGKLGAAGLLYAAASAALVLVPGVFRRPLRPWCSLDWPGWRRPRR